jgi:hypothetical protein
MLISIFGVLPDNRNLLRFRLIRGLDLVNLYLVTLYLVVNTTEASLLTIKRKSMLTLGQKPDFQSLSQFSGMGFLFLRLEADCEIVR